MARQKTVFGSNAQLAHVWAQQTQSKGKGNNMFFEGDTIYSYGYHYMIARIVTYKGKRIAFINSDGYSSSTANHTTHVLNALHGLVKYFYVPGEALRDGSTALQLLKAAHRSMLDIAKAEVERRLRTLKVDSPKMKDLALKAIADDFKAVNDCGAIFGAKAVTPTKATLDAVAAHYDARYKRYQELNTPEMIAKKEAAKAKRAAAEASRAEVEQAEFVAKFRKGETDYVYGLGFDIMRVQKDEIVTQRGARVPLKEAVALVRVIPSLKDVQKLKGRKVGQFRIDEVVPMENDALFKIGCHRVLLSEAKTVLESYLDKEAV